MHAAEDALVWQVMNDILGITQAWSPLWCTPIATRYWRDVRTVHLPAPRMVRCLHPYDARRGAWERFQEPRLIPALAHGQMTCTVIVPQPLHIQEVHTRLARETRIARYWQLVAFTSETWVVVARYLPMHIVDQLDELEQLREQVRAQRGG